MCAKLLKSCPTLAPLSMGVSKQETLPCLEWVAMPSSRRPSPPQNRTHISHLHWQAGCLPLAPLRKPGIKNTLLEI